MVSKISLKFEFRTLNFTNNATGQKAEFFSCPPLAGKKNYSDVKLKVIRLHQKERKIWLNVQSAV